MAMRALVAALLFGCCSIASANAAQPPNSIGTSRPGPLQSDPIQKRIESRQYPTDSAPLPVKVIEAPSDVAREHETDAREDENAESQKRAAMAAESQARAAWVTLPVSIVGTVFLLWTLYESRRSARAAIRAASAAEETARIMDKAERPYVFLNVINGVLFHFDIAFRVTELGNKAGPLDDIPSVKFDFVNSGKSPAIITAINSCLCIYSSKDIPVEPDYKQCTALLGEQIIMADKRSEMLTAYVRHNGEINEEQAADLDAGSSCFFFYGTVRYEDASGREYSTGFGMKAMQYDPRTVGKPRNFVAIGGRSYNYRT